MKDTCHDMILRDVAGSRRGSLGEDGHARDSVDAATARLSS
jgi:hypothetical protein